MASTLITVLIMIVCVLLALVILIQNSKGGGLASNFSAGNQIMSVKKTADTLENATWGLAIGLLIFSLVSAMTIDREGGSVQDTRMRDKIENSTPVQTQPVQQAPQAPAAQ
ncbi:MAG: preprotein translocase subunit SecG [Flavobacteriales bacterium]|nr:preprotein translocase subunit SecG [Flavobacteriales bacterium]